MTFEYFSQGTFVDMKLRKDVLSFFFIMVYMDISVLRDKNVYVVILMKILCKSNKTVLDFAGV